MQLTTNLVIVTCKNDNSERTFEGLRGAMLKLIDTRGFLCACVCVNLCLLSKAKEIYAEAHVVHTSKIVLECMTQGHSPVCCPKF